MRWLTTPKMAVLKNRKALLIAGSSWKAFQSFRQSDDRRIARGTNFASDAILERHFFGGPRQKRWLTIC
jgi:hypothetical protein